MREYTARRRVGDALMVAGVLAIGLLPLAGLAGGVPAARAVACVAAGLMTVGLVIGR